MSCSNTSEDVRPVSPFQRKVANCTAIAKPMATKKLTKRCFKLLKKAMKLGINNVLRGLKKVQKGIRRDVKGIVLLAGDVTPIDVMCHLPAVCESEDIPYVYVPSKDDLGYALGTKRSCITVLIKSHPDYKELFDKVALKLKYLPTH